MPSQTTHRRNPQYDNQIESLAEELAGGFGIDYHTIITTLALSLVEQLMVTMPPQQREHIIMKACDATRARLTPKRPQLHLVE